MLVDCDNCKAIIQAEEIGTYTNENPHDWVDAIKYTLNKCPKCGFPILVEQEMDYNGLELDWGRIKTIYPGNLFHINPIIPEQLQKALLECIQCFKADANTATVIMCRRTLEGFCALREIKERDLASSIKRLKDEGFINEQLYEWANQLRLAGNEAAHNIAAEFSAID